MSDVAAAVAIDDTARRIPIPMPPILPDLTELVERFREGGLIALIQTHEQRELMDRLQPVMAVIEGYSEHVMDALGVTLVPGYEDLRAAMDRRRRNRSG